MARVRRLDRLHRCAVTDDAIEEAVIEEEEEEEDELITTSKIIELVRRLAWDALSQNDASLPRSLADRAQPNPAERGN